MMHGSTRHLGWLVGALGIGTLAGSACSDNNHNKPDLANPTPRISDNSSATTRKNVSEKPKTPALTFKRPDHVRGIYLTAWSAGSKRKLTAILDMFDKTVLNAVVIDIRDDDGLFWKTGIALAVTSGAERVAVPKPQVLMQTLNDHGVYPIARIACFRDAFVPKKFPERAVQLPNGKIWRDRSGHSWLDPYNKKNWDYITSIVDFALNQGFPEVQLDYVRFPSEGKSATQTFPGKKSYGDGKAIPQDVIAAFADYMAKHVHARGAKISADIFGIISSSKSDQGIGQELEKIAAPFDTLSPMVYPSHFHKGEYGIKDPSLQPYAIIKKSLTDYKKRLPKMNVRPWLQDFFGYTADQIKAQIKAAKECGYEDFLLWNAGNHYTASAVAKPKPKG